MSAEKVVSLAGEPIKLPGTPQQDVIEILEKSLEMARSGGVMGVVLIRTHYDNLTTSSHAGILNRGTIGLLEQEKIEMVRGLIEEAG